MLKRLFLLLILLRPGINTFQGDFLRLVIKLSHCFAILIRLTLKGASSMQNRQRNAQAKAISAARDVRIALFVTMTGLTTLFFALLLKL